MSQTVSRAPSAPSRLQAEPPELPDPAVAQAPRPMDGATTSGAEMGSQASVSSMAQGSHMSMMSVSKLPRYRNLHGAHRWSLSTIESVPSEKNILKRAFGAVRMVLYSCFIFIQQY